MTGVMANHFAWQVIIYLFFVSVYLYCAISANKNNTIIILPYVKMVRTCWILLCSSTLSHTQYQCHTITAQSFPCKLVSTSTAARERAFSVGTSLGTPTIVSVTFIDVWRGKMSTKLAKYLKVQVVKFVQLKLPYQDCQRRKGREGWEPN